MILHHFYEHVRRTPDRVYMTQPMGGGRTEDFTFARTLDEAKRMASYLRSLNLPPRSNIAIVSKNCSYFVIADLAIWMTGHVSVAIYPTLNADTTRFILEHSEAKLLFIGKLDALTEVAKAIPAGLPCVAFPLAPKTDFPQWSEIIARHPPIPDEPRRQPDDWSLIIYTSGSTGRPKGVVHSFASISVPTHGIVKLLGIRSDDRYLSYLPMAHGMDRWLSECVSMAAGSHLFFAESLETFIADLKRARPTFFLSVPRLWLKFQQGVFAKMPPHKLARLLKIPILRGVVKRKILANLGLDHVRFAGSGSAPIPADVLQWYRDLGLELLEGYGMSENFNYSHVTRPGHGLYGYIGHPYDEVECKLGEEGEVLVKSPGTMVGYYKEPELTRESFTPDGFLKTGDRGEISPDGQLRLTGRVKELFKTSKGKYVAPVPIENRINSNHSIELSCVAGSGQPATHAVLQLSESLRPKLSDPAVRAELTKDLETLLDEINREVMGFERLAFVAVAREPWTIEGGQLTPTMKIRRSVIEKQYEPLLDRWYSTGQKVIWQE
ncbi:MAG TPA: AMP-binding protein [Myxococcales bacterium]